LRRGGFLQDKDSDSDRRRGQEEGAEEWRRFMIFFSLLESWKWVFWPHVLLHLGGLHGALPQHVHHEPAEALAGGVADELDEAEDCLGH